MTINVLLQTACFRQVLNVSGIEYFMYSFMLFHVTSVFVEKPSRFIFLAPLSCRHLYASCWFPWGIISLTKSLPENLNFESSWDLMPRFLRLRISDCFGSRHLNFIITLSDLFIRWQACGSSGKTLTLLVITLYRDLPPKHHHVSQHALGLIQVYFFYCIESS